MKIFLEKILRLQLTLLSDGKIHTSIFILSNEYNHLIKFPHRLTGNFATGKEYCRMPLGIKKREGRLIHQRRFGFDLNQFLYHYVLTCNK